MMAKDVLKQALMNYEGTMIIVSHDREFLDGLTDKTFEFKDNKISSYVGDINEYLDKTELESLQELEIKAQIANNKENISIGKQQREQQKASQKEINKQKRLIEKIENDISKLEEEISAIEEKFSDVELMSNPEQSVKLQNEYKTLKNNLDELMSQWENESELLMEYGG